LLNGFNSLTYNRKIQEKEVHRFNSTTISYWLSSKHPYYKRHIEKDRLITTERFGKRGNYFETLEEAKEFTRNKLERKIKKVELELLKYQNLLDNLK
jgi:hypothetical protein